MQPLNQLEKELLQKWLRKADGDLRAASRLAEAPEDFETAAFHCQQAAEKYLKARLAATGTEPPRTHDLLRLLALLAPLESFTAQEEKWAAELTPYGVAIRYPEDDDLEPPIEELLAAAHHFRDKLRSVVEALIK